MLALLKKIPGALMIVPLIAGALLNSLDQLHLAPIEAALKALGASPVVEPDGTEHYEILNLGGFTTAMTRNGAGALIGMFLLCLAAQMDWKVGARALRKGALITSTKLAVAIALGYAIGTLSDPFDGFLGLSTVAIIAALSNGNGGLFLALTGEYGTRSDSGAVSVISLNDGPFFTLAALGLMGEKLPIAALLAVLLPMVVGFLLGRNLTIRRFLAPGEKLCIPFFAFALGTTMNFSAFLNPEVLAGGLFLGVATVLLTGSASFLVLRLCGERDPVAGLAEASTAGNAVQTPLAVSLAALASAGLGRMDPERAALYESIVPAATAQISISTLVTAILCPLLVLWWVKRRPTPAA